MANESNPTQPAATEALSVLSQLRRGQTTADITLQAASAKNFRSGVRLKDGTHQLNYTEEVTATAGSAGQLQIPDRFAIKIAPFVGCEPQEIEARLRYRINDGKLFFAFKLNGPHLVLAEAWTAVRQKIQDKTQLRVLRGAISIQPRNR